MTDTPTDPRKLAKDAHPAVAASNAAMLKALPFHDRQDFEDARRGFIATLPDATIRGAAGNDAWTLAPYGFLSSESAPPTVNPSLWRQAQLNMNHGLFEVCDRIYQIRGFDLANMTLIEGETGVIVVDTLTSIEGARAGLGTLPQASRTAARHSCPLHAHPWRPLGRRARRRQRCRRSRRSRPDHCAEPVHGVRRFRERHRGYAMLRRAQYQFGRFLPPRRSRTGRLRPRKDRGVRHDLVAGADRLRHGNRRKARRSTGVEFVFQMAPESEAPAEFHFYLPQLKALNLAENACTIFTISCPSAAPRCAIAPPGPATSTKPFRCGEAEADVLLGQHHWPVWGNANVQTYLKQQRDLYKFLHDQTMRLINHGLTPSEIADTIKMPKSLEGAWHTRGYYGHYRHNVKAIYQRALGWYDGNPAHLDPLPPVASARNSSPTWVARTRCLRRRGGFCAGEFRFVAEVLNHLVFAEPGNETPELFLPIHMNSLAMRAKAPRGATPISSAPRSCDRGRDSLRSRDRQFHPPPPDHCARANCSIASRCG